MSNSLALHWLSDPLWLSMDATVRGLHTQLLLMACRRGGSIPDDESLWREWLGLPALSQKSVEARKYPIIATKWISEGTPDRLAELGGSALLLEHYWTTKWYPLLQSAWHRVDNGELTCELAQLMTNQPKSAQISSNQPTSSSGAQDGKLQAPKKKPIQKKTKGLAVPPVFEDLLNGSTLSKRSIPYLHGMNERLFSKDDVLGRWNVPVKRNERINLWVMATEILKNGTNTESQIQALIGRSIRIHGEPAVLEALIKLGQRTIQPSNPEAFFLGILKRNGSGFENQIKARDGRSSVVL